MTDDRQALSTARYSRAGQLATADTCLNAAADFELRNVVSLGKRFIVGFGGLQRKFACAVRGSRYIYLFI